MNGTPWELDQLPRQMYANPDDARFGAPPVRNNKRRGTKGKDTSSSSMSMLGTIDEWPNGGGPKPNGSSTAGPTANSVGSSSTAGSGSSGTVRQTGFGSRAGGRLNVGGSGTGSGSGMGGGVSGVYGSPLAEGMTSTTDLERDGKEKDVGGGEDRGHRKVQKAQVNALAKMLSALRR